MQRFFHRIARGIQKDTFTSLTAYKNKWEIKNPQKKKN